MILRWSRQRPSHRAREVVGQVKQQRLNEAQEAYKEMQRAATRTERLKAYQFEELQGQSSGC